MSYYMLNPLLFSNNNDKIYTIVWLIYAWYHVAQNQLCTSCILTFTSTWNTIKVISGLFLSMTVGYSIPFQLYRSRNGLIFHTCSGLFFYFYILLCNRKRIPKASVIRILWINCGIFLSQPIKQLTICWTLCFIYFLTHNTQTSCKFKIKPTSLHLLL